MKDYIPEKNLKSSVLPIKLQNMEQILFQMKNDYICKIYKNEGEDASGFFCRIPYKGKLLPFLISNNHVLKEENIRNGQKIEFSINEDHKYKQLYIDDSRITYTNEELDVTFIEIKPKRDHIDKFLDISEEVKYDSEYPYSKKSIYILHYPGGKDLNISFGLTKSKDIKKKYDLGHTCNTYNGSSGSPILSLDSLKVIAIHIGADSKERIDINHGTLMKDAIEYLNNNINSKIDNSMQYIPESNRKNVNNLTLSKNNDMENNSINNQTNINNNNNFNNKICLSEINNNNNLFNNMNNINNNNFNRINQMYFGNNQIYFGNNQMQNFIGINPNMNSTLIRLNMEFKLCCKDEC